MKGSFDFIGLNHFTTELVTPALSSNTSGWFHDREVATRQDPEWPQSATDGLVMVPWGFRNILNWIKTTYGNSEVLITANGFSDDGSIGLDDTLRCEYFTAYINELLKAITLDGCNVTAYTVWTLIDNFEWSKGYT